MSKPFQIVVGFGAIAGTTFLVGALHDGLSFWQTLETQWPNLLVYLVFSCVVVYLAPLLGDKDKGRRPASTAGSDEVIAHQREGETASKRNPTRASRERFPLLRMWPSRFYDGSVETAMRSNNGTR